MAQCSKKLKLVLTLILSLCFSHANVFAQDMEPRAYSSAPIGTNFLGAAYAYSSGDVSLDPSLPITDVEAKINVETFGFSRFFGIGEHTANASVLLPLYQAEVKGNIGEESREANRNGVGDMRLRFAYNILGSPALTPMEFRTRVPATTLGTSLSVVAPTGEYASKYLINIGANRWAFKPDIGISQPIGDWFVEASAGVWLFTTNDNFYGGRDRSQDPIGTIQLHSGYNVFPGAWLAADATYWEGGQTSVNGVEADDSQSSSRYGLTASFPLSESFSLKIAWSTGLTTRVGGEFDTILAAVQYRWFDGDGAETRQ